MWEKKKRGEKEGRGEQKTFLGVGAKNKLKTRQ